MKPSNRDLLVLVKNEFTSDQIMEQEIELLNRLLYHYETVHVFCKAHEILDLNRYRVLNKRPQIQRFVAQNQFKPFQFLLNKN